MQPRTYLLAGLGAGAAVIAAALLVFAPSGRDPTASAATKLTAAATRQVGGEDGQWYEYEPAFFAEDLTLGRTVLVAVHADWCIDCRAQSPIMSRLMLEPEFKDAVGYIVDFDHQRKFLAEHKVRTQSTLLVFKDGHEVTRAVAITSEPAIRALFEQGL